MKNGLTLRTLDEGIAGGADASVLPTQISARKHAVTLAVVWRACAIREEARQ